MIFKIILLLITLTILSFLIYLLYTEIPSIHEADILSGFIQEEIPEELLNVQTLQFYQNMRFNHIPITYFMAPECSQQRLSNMNLATSMLEEKTSILFRQINSESNADVKVGCDERRYKEEGVFIAGHGGPSLIINATPWSVIKKGVIILFTESCDEIPNIELHEMLHVLGFDHSPNPKNIMYNISSCDQKITNDIIDELNRLYSQEPLADLHLKNVSAVKQGRYLNIRFGIFNRGLLEADNVEVSLYADGVLFKTYDIEEGIDIGAGRYLNVDNLRLPKLSIEEIKLVADPKNYINEINEDDNTVILRQVE
ncbi:matrixin family metalloprotease [Candidatus Pacearchaeota archaeon]|nr:matrixin family metalloprotease [Candidatus Pacearchaeota archaeon]